MRHVAASIEKAGCRMRSTVGSFILPYRLQAEVAVLKE